MIQTTKTACHQHAVEFKGTDNSGYSEVHLDMIRSDTLSVHAIHHSFDYDNFVMNKEGIAEHKTTQNNLIHNFTL